MIFCLCLLTMAAAQQEVDESASPLALVNSISGPSRGVDFYGERMLLDRGADLELFDISDFTSPVLLTRWHLSRESEGAALYQDVVFVGLSGDNVRIYDISDPSCIPPEIGHLDFDFSRRSSGDLYRDGHNIHLASQYGSVLMRACYDITDPRQPRLFYTERGDNSYYGFNQIQHGIQYVLRSLKGARRGVVTYQIKYDDDRTTLGQHVFNDDIGGWEYVMFKVIGNRLYYLNGHRLWVLNVANPASPALLCDIDLLVNSHPAQYAYMPVAAESYILLNAGIYSNNQESVRTLLVDIADPKQPNTIQFPLQNVADAKIVEPYIFVQDGENSSLFIYDMEDPSHPRLIERISEWRPWWPIHKINEFIVIKKSSNILLLLDSSLDNISGNLCSIENINNIEWLDSYKDILVIGTDDELYFVEIKGHK